MSSPFAQRFDAVVIGGGFYGCVIALYLVKQRRLKRVALVESRDALMTRASYNNQARVHNGYHYPRSFTTAYRSRLNLPQFVRDWPSAVRKDFTKLYAIARHNSKVNARQFQRFCSDIGASLEPADLSLRQLFDPRLIEAVFVAQEYVFDAADLAGWARRELAQRAIDVRLRTTATKIESTRGEGLTICLRGEQGGQSFVSARHVFNCAYSGLNQIQGDYPGTATRLKHEIAEMALLEMPRALDRLGVTVMDGPFFSAMPFPARGLHTLSHVRYTPHLHWPDAAGVDPYKKLADYPKDSRAERMIRDSSRYLPAIGDARYVDSLFEIKTVLVKNEGDDGRPILFESCDALKGCYPVLGGKIDNVFDVLERLDALALV